MIRFDEVPIKGEFKLKHKKAAIKINKFQAIQSIDTFSLLISMPFQPDFMVELVDNVVSGALKNND